MELHAAECSGPDLLAGTVQFEQHPKSHLLPTSRPLNCSGHWTRPVKTPGWVWVHTSESESGSGRPPQGYVRADGTEHPRKGFWTLPGGRKCTNLPIARPNDGLVVTDFRVLDGG